MIGTAGCKDDGGGGGQLADAPPQGDAFDATPDTSVPLPVTLTVTRNGAPVAGVVVYIVKADGSPGETLATDQLGVASSLIADGGSVTAVNPFKVAGDQGSDELRTFMAVKAGDHLVLTDTDRFDDSAPHVEVTITAPFGPNAIDSWEAITPCGSVGLEPVLDGLAASNPTATVNLFGCGTSTDVLVIGRGEAGFLTALYNTGFTLPLEGHADIDVTGDYEDAGSIAVDYSHLPAEADTVSVNHTLASSLHGSLHVSSEASGGITDGDAHLLVLQQPLNAGLYAIVETQVQILDQASLASGHHVISFGPLPPDDTYGIDISAAGNQLLPDFTAEPDYEVANRRVAWTEAATGAAADFTLVSIAISRDPPQAVVPGLPPPGSQWNWRVVAPHHTGVIGFPTLPSTIRDWAPSATDGVQIDTLVNARVPGHYDAVRARILNDIDPSELAAAGSVVFVEALAQRRDLQRIQTKRPGLTASSPKRLIRK